MPLDLSEKFFERFGKRVMEGYGLTETSPVVSVNLPIQFRSGPMSQCSRFIASAPSEKWLPVLRRRFASPETNEKLIYLRQRDALAARSEYF